MNSSSRFSRKTEPKTVTKSKYIQRYKKSYGIACCRYNLVTKEPEVLMIKKRYTYAFFNFVFTKYKKNDDIRLRKLFDQMSIQEKADILQLDFDKLWIRIRIKIPNPPETNRTPNRNKSHRPYNKQSTRFNVAAISSMNKQYSEHSHSLLPIFQDNKQMQSENENCSDRPGISTYLSRSHGVQEHNSSMLSDNSDMCNRFTNEVRWNGSDKLNNRRPQKLVDIYNNRIYYPDDEWRTYYIKKDKFNRNFILSDKGKRLKKLVDGTKSIDSIWEIPKGRPGEDEKPINTAIREFKEETDLSIDSYTFLTHIRPIVNSYIVNRCQYTHIYFVAVAKDFKLDPKINFQSYEQMTEVENLQWVSLQKSIHLNLKQVSPHLRILKLIKQTLKIFKENYRKAHV